MSQFEVFKRKDWLQKPLNFDKERESNAANNRKKSTDHSKSPSVFGSSQGGPVPCWALPGSKRVDKVRAG